MAKPLIIQNIESCVLRNGDSMEGFLSLFENPTENSHAATKEYVDNYTQPIPLPSKTVYVSPTGSDNNDGLTENTPKLSIRNTILEFQGNCGRLTIKLANGEYNEELGGLSVRVPDLAIQGIDTETPGGSAIINITEPIYPTGPSIRFHHLTIKMADSVTDASAVVNQMGKLYMQNCKITIPEASTKYCVSTVYGGASYLRNCIFNPGTTAGAAIVADQAILVKVIAPTSDRTSFYRDFYALNGADIEYTSRIAGSVNAPYATATSQCLPIYPLASTTKSYIVGMDNSNTYNKQLNYNSSVYTEGTVLYGAAWNDYAEYRISDCKEPGRIICENGDDTLSLSIERLQPGANVISDTFGFAIGETKEAKTPVAVSGRVLAYPYENRNIYKPGDAVCAAPGGTVSKMTREEIREYPERIIGTVSAIPEYEIWGEKEIQVNNRIWIKIK